MSVVFDREARIDLIRASMQTWRSSLGGGTALVLIVACAFSAFGPAALLWPWAVACVVVYALQAGLLLRLERQQDARQPDAQPLARAPAMVACGVLSGSLWGALGWLLPADAPTSQLLAAMSCGMALVGAAAAVTSMELLWALGVPSVALVAAGLVWRAGLPLAGAVALTLGLLILRHGRAVRCHALEALHQRRRFDALAAELQAEQARLQEAEHEKALLNERQRLLRDMHDGIGASLISALKLIEKGELSLNDAARVLRECVDDLRLVVDSLEPIEHDLVTLLASLRYRLGSRIQDAGITIDWRMGDLPPVPWLNATQALEVLRMVQEALANVLKHSGAHRVLIELDLQRHGDGRESARLRIEDDGIGFVIADGTGRGLHHLRQRAAHIGARIEIDSAPGRGTRLTVHMPIER